LGHGTRGLDQREGNGLPAVSAITDPAEWLRTVVPFDRLNAAERAEAARVVQTAHFGATETVLPRWRIPGRLFVVADGMVEEHDAIGIVDRFGPGQAFDYRAIVQGRTETTFIARQTTTCVTLPTAVVQVLIRGNMALRAFWDEEVIRKADALIALQQQREAGSLLLIRLGDALLHPPLFVDATTTLQGAVEQMKQHGTSYVLVRRDDGAVGIFTGRDVREKSVLMGLDSRTPIAEIASFGLARLDREDFLFNALVMMTERAIRHVVVTDGRDIVGVFEQADLLRYVGDSSFAIANRVERASSVAELEQAGRAIPRLIAALHGRGVKPRYIARVVTDLNRRIFRRLFEQVVPADIRADACLMVMGSEGRAEQLLPTDQDNAVIFGSPPEHARIEEPLLAFSQALGKMGYPPCPGKVMVSNPAWAREEAAYRRDLTHWLFDGEPEGLLNLAIFYDAASVAGDGKLLDRLKDHLFELLKREGTHIGYFAKAILQFPLPVGFLGRFVVEKTPPHAGKLDIKKGGLFPIVHGIRALALEQAIRETNTIGRIHALVSGGSFTESFAADLIEAFEFMSMLRLRAQLAGRHAGTEADNYVAPATLSKLERGLLLASLKVVDELKKSVRHHFKMELIS
jgi:CBS domain-containing protein